MSLDPPIRHAVAVRILMDALGIDHGQRTAVDARIRQLQRHLNRRSPRKPVGKTRAEYEDQDLGELAFAFALMDAHVNPKTVARLVAEQNTAIREALAGCLKDDLIIILPGSGLADMTAGDRHGARYEQEIPTLRIESRITDLPLASVTIRPAAFMVRIAGLAEMERQRLRSERRTYLERRRADKIASAMRSNERRRQEVRAIGCSGQT